jgi:predicted dehydrogenase
MGWWGRTIVESVQRDSDVIRFVAGCDAHGLARGHPHSRPAQKLTLAKDFNALLADTNVDAVVLATPHSSTPSR